MKSVLNKFIVKVNLGLHLHNVNPNKTHCKINNKECFYKKNISVSLISPIGLFAELTFGSCNVSKCWLIYQLSIY